MAACSIQTTLASVLQRLRILEDNQSRNNAAISKLRLEVDDGSSRIQELEFSHEAVLREINCLLQRFGEQIATSRRKEQEKLRAAFVRLREEIEEERITCRLLKLQNKKLMKELEEANIMAADAGEELDRERKARELMEEVCNELAREIGEDKAEVEQLKQEQAKSRQIVEDELKIIRNASLWRDEKVKAKLSKVQLDLGDKHHVGMPVVDLKTRVEDFVSSVSAASGDAYKASSNTLKVNKDEPKHLKMLDQDKLPKQVLELSMQPVLDGGAVLNKEDLKEEKIMAPCMDDPLTHTDVCNCCAGQVDDSENQNMRYGGAYFELQVSPSDAMANYSKKPCPYSRRLRSGLGDVFLDNNALTILNARRHLISQHDSSVEAEQVGASRRNAFESNYTTQGGYQGPNPEFFIYEGGEIRLAASKLKKEQGPSTAMFVGSRGELVQGIDSVLESSNCTPRMEEMLREKKLILHFQGSEDSHEENEAWDDDMMPEAGKAQYCSEDDVSYACMDVEGGFNAQQYNSRKGQPPLCALITKQAYDTQPWRSPGILQEHLGREDDRVDYHAKSLCADEADSGQRDHGELDRFYFEPTIEDGLRDDCGRPHYGQDTDGDGRMSVDEHVDAMSRANGGGSPRACHDGGGRRINVRSSSKLSQREEIQLPPHKLILPTPCAIRVPLVKPQYTSPRNAARSLSPSKPQVLQCFRPSPTSPEHYSVKLAGSLSSKDAGKGSGMGSEHIGGFSSSWASKACLLRVSSSKRTSDITREEENEHCENENQGQGKEACGSGRRGAMEKGNSLRAELLKARELDLQQHGELADASLAAASPHVTINKSASSSFRFSPIRRSLTNNSQASR